MYHEKSWSVGVAAAAALLLPESEKWPLPTEGWGPDQASTRSAAPPKGTFFDEAFDFRDPDGDVLTLLVLAEVATIENRKNRRSALEYERHYRIVRSILSNGFRCFYHRSPSRVSYWRKADGYRNKPDWLSGKAMARTVDLLGRAGLLKLTRGVHGINKPGTASTFDITQRLYDIGLETRITDRSIVYRLPPERLVRLRTSDRDRATIVFEPTSATKRWTTQLIAWNDFIDRQNIGIELTHEDERSWVSRLNNYGEQAGMPLYRPELIRKQLYRKFVGDFDGHGRLYGGWWINAPAHLRQKITINGEATVELDFSGCSIRMLYHQRGLQCPLDPYELGPITAHEEKNGFERGYFRDTLKAVMQALINCSERGRPENIIRKHGLSCPSGFTPKEIRVMLERKHEPIAEMFRSRAGLALQRQDSDLALEIISHLREEGIVALPIHDSFITTIGCESALRKTMEDKYQTAFRALPVIK